MSRPEFTVELPSRRADGTWRYPCQVIVSEHGKWETGKARFELVGYVSDLAHRQKLEAFLL